MSWLRRLLQKWPVLAAALIAAAIVHIVTVFALPMFYRADAYSRLSRSLPAHSFVILPAARPKAQVLPYQLPDTRYAVCRFDLRGGPMLVKASLAEQGWTLSAYTAAGESFYAIPANEQRRLGVSLLFVPSGERFIGSMSNIRGVQADTTQVQSPTQTGLIVIQAPLKGRAYAVALEAELAKANCASVQL